MTTALEARDVEYGYVASQRIIDGWSASFDPGTLTALTGPSGSGKSTLLYLFGLMLRPAAGEILVEGDDTSRLRDRARASIRSTQFGFVFQDAALDPTRSVLDNVTEAALYRHRDPRDSIPQALDLLDRFGVDVPPHRKPGQVSGGQAQRIALCRALLGSPSLLLADEPTGNLDPATSDVVLDALRTHAASGAAVIVVTHSPTLAAMCDAEVRI